MFIQEHLLYTFIEKIGIESHTIMINKYTKVILILILHIYNKDLDRLRKNEKKYRILVYKMPKFGNKKGNKGSSYYGVYHNKKDNTWSCKINHSGKTHIFGPFNDELSAAKCYDNEAPNLIKNIKKYNFKTINKPLIKKIKPVIVASRVKRGGIERETIFAKYSHKCNICSKSNDITFELDHIIPLEYNGDDDMNNLQPLCRACHKIKTNRIDKLIAIEMQNNPEFCREDAFKIQTDYMRKNGYINVEDKQYVDLDINGVKIRISLIA